MPPSPSPAHLLASAQASLLEADVDTAKDAIRRALLAAEALDDRRLQARATALLARAHCIADEPGDGMATALRAIDLGRAAGDAVALARAHQVVAHLLLTLGETDAALAEGLAALKASEAGDELEATAAAMQALANVYGQLCQWDTALEFGERCCEATRLLGDRAAESAAIDTVAWLHGAMHDEAVEQGDRAAADRHAAESERRSRAALRLAQDAGNRLGEATCLANLAESLSDTGRHAEALALLDGWAIDPARITPTMASHHGHARGTVLARLGRHAEALGLLTRCLAEAPTLLLEIAACRALGQLLETTGDLRAALDHQKRLFALVSRQRSETARRAASITAVRIKFAQVQTEASRYRAQASDLQRSNVRLSRRSEDLQRQVLEDPLTGLPNRRRLEQLLAATGQPCSIVMIDVDHFKHVNDAHSHLVGDAVLRELARLLRANCREGDLALRFGGEEFALLLGGASDDGAMAAAERARASIEAHTWSTLSSGLAVTASFGVALGSEAPTGLDLLALADRRLYAAKADGRNRVAGPG